MFLLHLLLLLLMLLQLLFFMGLLRSCCCCWLNYYFSCVCFIQYFPLLWLPLLNYCSASLLNLLIQVIFLIFCRIVIRSEDCSYVAEGDQNGDCKKSTAICSQCDLLQRRGQRLRAGKGPGPRGPKSAQRKRRRLRLPPHEEEEEGGEHIYLKEEQGVGTKDILSRYFLCMSSMSTVWIYN